MKRFFAGLTVLCLAGCTGDSGTPAPGAIDFDRAALVQNLADTIVLPAYEAFAVESEALLEATNAWRDATAAGAAPAEREVAMARWRAANQAWQRAELMQFGPAAGAVSGQKGALDLRDEIYSWPEASPCAIDQQLVANEFSAAGWFADAFVNVKGLDALEYLLFLDATENACAGAASINQDGSWDALSAETLLQRRAAFSAGAAGYLQEAANALLAAWQDQAGYRAKLLLEDESFFDDSGEALDDIYYGLFYLEFVSKDQKLAIPLGISPDCANAPCLDALESPWARAAQQNLVANLDGFKALLTGGDGVGFDDFLEAADEAEFATTMIENTDVALLAAEAVDADLGAVLQTDPSPVEAVYEALRILTFDVKTEFAAILQLQLPLEADGDND